MIIHIVFIVRGDRNGVENSLKEDWNLTLRHRLHVHVHPDLRYLQWSRVYFSTSQKNYFYLTNKCWLGMAIQCLQADNQVFSRTAKMTGTVYSLHQSTPGPCCNGYFQNTYSLPACLCNTQHKVKTQLFTWFKHILFQKEIACQQAQSLWVASLYCSCLFCM